MGAENAGGRRSDAHILELAEAIRHLAAQIECPVWIAWVRSDRVIPRAMCRAAPNRKITPFRGGHSAVLEDPERFAKGFKAFAKKALR